MSKLGHRHNRLLQDVSLDEIFKIGKEEGWSDEYIHAIWNYRRMFTKPSQGWCEQCFRDTFTKYKDEFDAAREQAGLS